MQLSPFCCAGLQSTLTVIFGYSCFTSELPEPDTKRKVGTFSPESPMRAGDSLWIKSAKLVLICIGNQESGRLEELPEQVVQGMTLDYKVLTALPILTSGLGQGGDLERLAVNADSHIIHQEVLKAAVKFEGLSERDNKFTHCSLACRVEC